MNTSGFGGSIFFRTDFGQYTVNVTPVEPPEGEEFLTITVQLDLGKSRYHGNAKLKLKAGNSIFDLRSNES